MHLSSICAHLDANFAHWNSSIFAQLYFQQALSIGRFSWYCLATVQYKGINYMSKTVLLVDTFVGASFCSFCISFKDFLAQYAQITIHLRASFYVTSMLLISYRCSGTPEGDFCAHLCKDVCDRCPESGPEICATSPGGWTERGLRCHLHGLVQ